MPYNYYHQTPIGILKITAEEQYITGVSLCTKELSNAEPAPPTALLKEACKQSEEYFAGERTTFTLPIAYPHGTPFQQSVWNALRDIPYGETRSYEDIARAINKNGTIGGFGCGMEVKRKLLELEGVNIK